MSDWQAMGEASPAANVTDPAEAEAQVIFLTYVLNFVQTYPLIQPYIFALSFQLRDLHKPHMPKSCAPGIRILWEVNKRTSAPAILGDAATAEAQFLCPIVSLCFIPFLKMCFFGDREMQIYIYTHVGSQLSDLDHIYIYICV